MDNILIKVVLYTRPASGECLRVRQLLEKLAPSHNFELQEAPSPEGAPAPCVRFVVPGSPFHNAENITEAQFLEYLNEAKATLAPPQATTKGASARTTQPKPKAGSLPTADFEASHPVRSYLWRHRVGAIIASLAGFVGLAYGAALAPALGWGTGFYDAIHRTYRLFCDQVPERSADIGGFPVCLCWRCTAIYLGALFFGIVYTVARDRKISPLGWLTRPVSIWIMLLFGLPLILDGASHALGWRSDISYANSGDFWLSWQTLSFDWWLRIGTALLATVAAVKFLCPRLDKLGYAYEKLHAMRKRETNRALEPSTTTVAH